MSESSRPELGRLADHLGILPDYHNITGQRILTSDQSREALTAALGYDGSTEESARCALDNLEFQRQVRLIDPVQVILESQLGSSQIAVRGPLQVDESFDWQLTITQENGSEHVFSGRNELPTSLNLPPHLPIGYHSATIHLNGSRMRLENRQHLIVAPDRCYDIDSALGPRRVWGCCAQLYSLRSPRNWGVGDLGDLGRLCNWTADQGGDFVGLNPLHALDHIGKNVSPYSPVSRLFYHILYMDISAVPELQQCPPARRFLESTPTQQQLDRLRESPTIDYPRILDLKLRAMRLLFETFADHHLQKSTPRGTAFDAYRARQGHSLCDFATFTALEEHFLKHGSVHSWPEWPTPYHDPRLSQVEEFRRQNSREISFYSYLQFELDRQLAHVAQNARQSGMCLGLYQDLAIGAPFQSCDAWANPGLFVRQAALGAPPDDYNQAGQNWGLAPLHPHRLQEQGYLFWKNVLRTGLAHGGALRIDHIMGLSRQYWIPAGSSPENGAYIRFPVHEFLAVLAIESRRAQAVIIGEDLGTVPEGFSQLLDRWGILSCQVVYFQRDASGDFISPNRYSNRAFLTVSTHDHPPLAGYWQSQDLYLRRRIGLIPDDEKLEEAIRRREQEKHRLLKRLQDEKLLEPKDPNTYSLDEVCGALHVFLALTPAPLIGLMLDDLTGEVASVNIPGVGPEQYQCWSRPMSAALPAIEQDARIPALMRQIRERLSRS